MSGWGTKLLGFDRTMDAFDRIQTNWTGDAVYVVGSNVEYSIYQEFGTSKMPPQPYLRPAVRDFNRNPRGYIAKHTSADVSSIDSMDELVRLAALAIESDAADRAPVDDGNLMGSIKSEKVR